MYTIVNYSVRCTVYFYHATSAPSNAPNKALINF